jgi:transketolase
MGAADIATVLYTKFLKFDPSDPQWADRDRFILSAGHGSMLLYALLYLTGTPGMTMDELKSFRQWGSKTPGHPESHLTPGVEVTTGPLGQGISTAVGMAAGIQMLAARFNQVAPVSTARVFGICSDGDVMEGISGEAASLAGHLGLGNLVFFYDDNKIQIDGGTDLAFTEDVMKRYEAYGWQTIHVEDGDTDLLALEQAIASAKAELSRPTLIKVTTTIGYGSAKQGTAGVHGAPLGYADLANVKKQYGFAEEAFFNVPEDVAAAYGRCKPAGAEKQQSWQKLL